MTFICDIIVAWALYVLLRPVNKPLSMLTAWFRLIYTAIALVALTNLVTVLQLIWNHDYSVMFGESTFYGQVKLLFDTFRNDWSFGLLFFGIHLGLLGYLVLRSGYIPKYLGWLLMLSGVGYVVSTFRPLFPDAHFDLAAYTFYGELVFMLWLLIRGWKIGEPINVQS